MLDWVKRHKQAKKVSKKVWHESCSFVVHVAKRCIRDRMTITAGYLTYVTLFALVPFIAVVFAILTAFPIFDDMRQRVEELIIQNVMPASGEMIQDYLNQFIENSNQLSAVGSIFLFVVAIKLMLVTEKAFNHIWRIKKKRHVLVKFPMYWTILTMGPLLVGVSIGASSYLLAATEVAENYMSGVQSLVLTLLPFITTMIAFLLLYVLVPNKKIRIRHAIWGAAISALAFEVAKNGMSMYLNYFPSYRVIYGAVAAVPLLILWIFISWNIILFGGEFTASVEEYLGVDDNEDDGDDSEGDGPPADPKEKEKVAEEGKPV